MLGTSGPNLDDNVYLIDFGLAGTFRTSDGSHILNQSIDGFFGNLIFASIN